jgi:cell division septal protein FtsQ
MSVLIRGVTFIVVQRARNLFQHLDYFNIRSIDIDPSLQFIDKRDVKNLVGKNIFAINLKAIEHKLSYKYPQASQLKVTKRFPDQISVIAKQRMPIAQIQIQDKTVIIDEEGVILALENEKNKNLMNIVGAKLKNPKLVLGLPLRGTNLWMALKIIKSFKENSSLTKYSISEINVENLSKIYFTLDNNLEIIVDRDKVAQKMRVLGVILSQEQLDFKHVKYVDLRFKEPVIGKK